MHASAIPVMGSLQINDPSTFDPAERRDELIALGLPLVRRLAVRIARRLPPHVSVDDLIGAGTEGLMRAIAAFDPDRFERFEPYAEARIRGAILDELRAADTLTRHARRRLAEISSNAKALEQQLGRQPTDEEVASSLGLDVDSFMRLSAELGRGPALSHVGAVDPDEVESEGVDPSDLASDQELRSRLLAAMAKLPERTQQVLAHYYLHDRTQAEIGRLLGVTESRVCQILGHAANQLRRSLEESPRALRFAMTKSTPAFA